MGPASEAVLRAVRKGAGYPLSPRQEFWLRRCAAWERAVNGDPRALQELIESVEEDFHLHTREVLDDEARTGDHPPEGKGKPRRDKRKRDQDQSDEGVRPDSLAERAGGAFRVYHHARFWPGAARSWKIKRHGKGVAPEGPWEDVLIDTGRVFEGKPVSIVLRLGREPLLVEGPDRWPVPRIPTAFSALRREMMRSVFDSLLNDLRAYSSMLGWSEAQTFWYLVRGKTPKPEVTVRVVEADPALGGVPELAFKSVVVTAQDRTSAREVSAAFARAVKRTRGAPKKLSTDAVVKFVGRKLRDADRRPPWKPGTGLRWSRLWQQWEAERPPGHERFRNAYTMRKRYRRALRLDG